jgi:hypothetical protein
VLGNQRRPFFALGGVADLDISALTTMSGLGCDEAFNESNFPFRPMHANLGKNRS